MTDERKSLRGIPGHFLPALMVGLACGLIIIGLSFTKLSRRAELKTLDLRYRRSAALEKKEPPKNIAIIAIDPLTNTELGMEKENRPTIFWIPYFSAVTSKLLESGAKVIAFDLIPRISTDEYFKELFGELKEKLSRSGALKSDVSFEESIPRWDYQFAQVITGQNVIFGGFIDSDKKWQRPINQIFFASEGVNCAHVNQVPDEDQFIRSVEITKTDSDGDTHLGFSFMAASMYLNSGDAGGKEFDLSTIKTESNNRMIINYAGGEGSFPTFSFWKVLRKAEQGDKKYFSTNFGDRIVLIGDTDPAQLDIKRTPFEAMPGVEVHANAINTILNRDYLKSTPPWVNYAIILSLSIIVAGFCFGLTGSAGVIMASGALLIYAVLACYLFIRTNTILPMAMPLAGGILAAGVTYIYRYSVEDREKRRMRGLFERYVSAPVVHKIMESPGSLDLEGQYTEVSVLFSDINGFTTLSEQMYPHEVIAILNEYFELMIDIVFKHNGTLKQFVGDEIMAIYGAPYHHPDHVAQAAATAVEMMEVLENWKKQREKVGKRAFDIKIGLHTGTVVCGNVGSSKRTEYAAVGDMVNTGARIMALNSKVKTTSRILASRDFYESVKHLFEGNYIGEFPLKGKDVQIAVYEIKGKKEVEDQ